MKLQIKGYGEQRNINAFSCHLRGTGANGVREVGDGTPDTRGNDQVNKLSAKGLATFGYKLKVIPTQ